jgi:hypothetical protein
MNDTKLSPSALKALATSLLSTANVIRNSLVPNMADKFQSVRGEESVWNIVCGMQTLGWELEKKTEE